jgi:hypothetical protein
MNKEINKDTKKTSKLLPVDSRNACAASGGRKVVVADDVTCIVVILQEETDQSPGEVEESRPSSANRRISGEITTPTPPDVPHRATPTPPGARLC